MRLLPADCSLILATIGAELLAQSLFGVFGLSRVADDIDEAVRVAAHMAHQAFGVDTQTAQSRLQIGWNGAALFGPDGASAPINPLSKPVPGVLGSW